VALYGPFGWGNLGDAAIQEAMIDNIRLRLPEVELVGICLNPDNTREIHGIPAIPIFRKQVTRCVGGDESDMRTGTYTISVARRFKARLKSVPVLFRFLQTLKSCVEIAQNGLRELCFLARTLSRLRGLDVLVISGGGQISDEWGGPWHHPAAILKWITCARIAGTRVYVVSVGVGPIRRPLSGALFRLALRLAHYRSYRDRESHSLLAPSGFTRADPVYPDLAFSLPVRQGGGAPRGGRPLVIGVSPMSYCHPGVGAWPVQDRERYDRYRETLAELGRHALSSDHSVSIFTSQIQNDRFAFDDFSRLLADSEATAARKRLLADPTRNLAQLISQISATDVVIASRLHGVILSFLLHKPVIALSYDPKVAAVMRQFGQSAFCLDIETATADLVRERLDALCTSLEEVTIAIRATATSHRARLEEQFDHLFGHRLEARERAGI
jgi:polysaccharide pyruvyl transferase WcaK-like protein